jgi:hypothetical protein
VYQSVGGEFGHAEAHVLITLDEPHRVSAVADDFGVTAHVVGKRHLLPRRHRPRHGARPHRQDPGRRGHPEPVELVRSYYPLDITRGTALTGLRKIKGGTPTLLTDLGFPPRHAVDRVSARVPTQEQYRWLKLPGDLPVLRTLRVVYSDDDRPVEATVMIKAGHLYELRYEFTPE